MGSRYERLIQLTERTIARGVATRIGRLHTEDTQLEGSEITVDGRRVVDFGSCSYLAINRRDELKAAATDAVQRFGTSHSSSPMYTSVGLYADLEERLARIMGATVAVAPTTTLAHMAALPVLSSPNDLVLIDHNAHASLHLAADVLRGRGVTVEQLPHNDVGALAARLHAAGSNYRRVWYVADGIYSMFGDPAPVRDIAPLLDKYPHLHLYYDDAHGFGWEGRHGRGYVLSQVDWHERMVIAAGLSKSFGTNGGVLAFGDPDLARTVSYTGASFMFSGPVPIPSLGASVASADFHLSPEHETRRRAFKEHIVLARRLLLERGLPVADTSETPIWFVKVGNLGDVLDLVRDLMDDGYYVNPAGYPAVAMGDAGIRFTQTLHHSEAQLRGLVDAIVKRIPASAGELTIDLRSGEPVATRHDKPVAPIRT
jgi:7-keto-8-aminopelargonate synthetase-like enzyme